MIEISLSLISDVSQVSNKAKISKEYFSISSFTLSSLLKGRLTFKWSTLNPRSVRISGLFVSWRLEQLQWESSSISGKCEGREQMHIVQIQFAEGSDTITEYSHFFVPIHLTWYQLSQSSHWIAFLIVPTSLVTQKAWVFNRTRISVDVSR